MFEDSLSGRSSHVAAFSTEMLPEHNRLDIFREEFARQVARLDFAIHDTTRFRADFAFTSLGDLTCGSISYMPASCGRTPDLIKDGNDDFVLLINCGETFHESGSDALIASGAAALKDNTVSGVINCTRPGTMISVSIPRGMLLRACPEAEDLGGRLQREAACELQLISTYARTMLSAPHPTAATLQIAGTHLLDLVVLALRATEPSAAEEPPGKRAARAIAVRDSIMGRIGNPALSLTQIARIHGISERYVQQLLADTGLSFSDFVTEQRLLRAMRLLTSPAHRNLRIAEIAFEAGFSDISHFNRTFRRRFGDTPGSFRIR